ncbi:hypothetical protein Pcinc_040378 [Petrolisthes cinctipes]|uniref:Uncharacterized protein n=1 Tax=Petrolisthes cinctipes TaxID=88211 RepID=A0AAE1EIP2_PETCI|nr:hypothetical protein Pcinc_040378 [Petrolisthes cinctipes]
MGQEGRESAMGVVGKRVWERREGEDMVREGVMGEKGRGRDEKMGRHGKGGKGRYGKGVMGGEGRGDMGRVSWGRREGSDMGRVSWGRRKWGDMGKGNMSEDTMSLNCAHN